MGVPCRLKQICGRWKRFLWCCSRQVILRPRSEHPALTPGRRRTRWLSFLRLSDGDRRIFLRPRACRAQPPTPPWSADNTAAGAKLGRNCPNCGTKHPIGSVAAAHLSDPRCAVDDSSRDARRCTGWKECVLSLGSCRLWNVLSSKRNSGVPSSNI